MKKMVALTLALLMAASLFLSGCSVSVRKDTSDSENSGSSNGSGSGDRVVNVCSWGEYIDESLIDQFEEATGIKVNYQTAESNEVLYSQLSMGGVDYDVIVPSDYMISQLIEEDMLAELNYDNIPNFEKIDDRFKNLSYDPENKYTVPYTWGTLGIIYNTAKVQEPITSWSAMFDPQYAGNVLLINNSRDALGIALLYLGYSVNTTDEAEIPGEQVHRALHLGHPGHHLQHRQGAGAHYQLERHVRSPVRRERAAYQQLPGCSGHRPVVPGVLCEYH